MTAMKIIVKQVRSGSGHTQRQKRTLDALGLGKIGRTVEHDLTPALEGMVKAVSHLVVAQRLR